MTDRLILDAENEYSISKAAEDFMKNVLAAYDKMLEAEIEANIIVLNGNKFSFLKKPGFTPTLFGMKVEYANLPESLDFYLQYREERKTNADRIRAMTDEELAKWYFYVFFKRSPYCSIHEDCPEHDDCELCLLDWLREEVIDDP